MSVRYVKGRACYPIPTVYTLDYRWPPFQEVIRHKEVYELEKRRTGYTKEEAEALLKRLHSSRLRTNYDVSYTLPLSKRISVSGKEDEEAAEESGNEKDNIMMMFKKTYWEDVCPRPLPDLPGTIKVFGPSRPDFRLMGLSEYQDNIGRLGYEKLLKRKGDKRMISDECRRISGRVKKYECEEEDQEMELCGQGKRESQ